MAYAYLFVVLLKRLNEGKFHEICHDAATLENEQKQRGQSLSVDYEPVFKTNGSNVNCKTVHVQMLENIECA